MASVNVTLVSAGTSVSTLTPRPNNKSIFIQYYGGTLGMRKDPETGALSIQKDFLLQQMATFGELRAPEMPEYKLVENEALMDSSDMGPEDWKRIAERIEACYFDYDGFVVIMGTDTMAYCASAVSFMLENLGKPVIFTGAQIPLSDIINDARRNLSASMLLAANLDIPEVCVFFNNTLLRANRTTKVDSWGLAAFDSPNFLPLATLGVEIIVNNTGLRAPPKGRFRVHTDMNRNIAVLHLVPGFSDDILHNLLQPPIEGVVIRSYGTGNAPQKKRGFLEALENAARRGMIVVVCSQCQKGMVMLEKYATGLSLQRAGAISVYDMTIEAAATKLGYLLGQKTLTREQIKTLMQTDLRGELTRAEDLATLRKTFASKM